MDLFIRAKTLKERDVSCSAADKIMRSTRET